MRAADKIHKYFSLGVSLRAIETMCQLQGSLELHDREACALFYSFSDGSWVRLNRLSRTVETF